MPTFALKCSLSNRGTGLKADFIRQNNPEAKLQERKEWAMGGTGSGEWVEKISLLPTPYSLLPLPSHNNAFMIILSCWGLPNVLDNCSFVLCS